MRFPQTLMTTIQRWAFGLAVLAFSGAWGWSAFAQTDDG